MQQFKLGMVVYWHGLNWVVINPGTGKITVLDIATNTKKVISTLDPRPVIVADNIKQHAVDLIIENF